MKTMLEMTLAAIVMGAIVVFLTTNLLTEELPPPRDGLVYKQYFLSGGELTFEEWEAARRIVTHGDELDAAAGGPSDDE